MSDRRVLITGGSGFIGFHLARRLLADPGTSITLADNFARGRMDGDLEALCNDRRVRLVIGDLRDPGIRARLGADYDEVYHFAALLGVENVLKRPVEVLKTNALLTCDILEWFVDGGGKKLLFSSTSEAYAWTQQFYPLPIPTPEEVPLSLTDLRNPRSTYAGSKVFGELCVTQYCTAAAKPFTIVRYHNVYGPRMGYDHVIPQIYERASGGERPLSVYSADHVRAFCYVDDAVAATVAAMRSESADGETFNIGNDLEEITIGDLADRILRSASIQVETMPKPAPNDPIKRRCADVSKARRLLGYEPAVPLDAGLAETIAWYARNPRAVAT